MIKRAYTERILHTAHPSLTDALSLHRCVGLSSEKWVFPASGRSENEILLEMTLQTERLQNSIGLGEEEDMIDEEDEEGGAGGKGGKK